MTEDLGNPPPPYSLGSMADVGCLQLSFALYVGGERPNPTPQDALELSLELGREHGLGEPHTLRREEQPIVLGAASFGSDGEFVRLWTLSDSWSFVRASYVCDLGRETEQLHDCEFIVRSIQLPRSTSAG